MTAGSSFASRRRVGLKQFVKFGIVGGSGTIVNMAVLYVVKRVAAGGWGVHPYDAVWSLPNSPWNIRFFHVFMVLAFLVANTWNYQLNRSWTFRGVSDRGWWRGFFPFLASGLVSLVVSVGIATLLMNPTSPIGLPSDVFDDSSGIRTKYYWATAISILVAMPVNFIINKVWAFRKPKIVSEATPY